jgi:PAS domain S-box-containing protein
MVLDSTEFARFTEKLIEDSSQGVVFSNGHEEVLLFNAGAERICGYRAEEVVGKMKVMQLCPPGVVRELRRQFFSERFGGRGRLEGIRTEVLTRTGERVPVAVTSAILYDGEALAGAATSFRDLRDRVYLEEQLSHAQAQLEKGTAHLMLAELAGTAAHELNQPLTSIMGYAELLRRKLPDTDPNAATVDIIIHEAVRMADLVRRIGKITRYETKSYVGDSRIVDLERAVEDED